MACRINSCNPRLSARLGSTSCFIDIRTRASAASSVTSRHGWGDAYFEFPRTTTPNQCRQKPGVRPMQNATADKPAVAFFDAIYLIAFNAVRICAGSYFYLTQCPVPAMRAVVLSSTTSGVLASSQVSLFKAASRRYMSRSPVHLATTKVATPLPTRLVRARASDMKRSIPRIRAKPATGT